MKPRNASSPLTLALAAALAVSTAFAQSQPQVSPQDEDAQTADVAVARCAYTPHDADCAEVSSSRQESPAGDLAAAPAAENDSLVAQYPRGRMSGPRMRRPAGYGRPYGRPYGSPWFHQGNPAHAVIGALILGGLGAGLAVNAHPSGQSGPNVLAALFVGGLGATFGALIGNNIPEHHSYRHRNHWPEDDDEDASVRNQRLGSAPSPDGGVGGSTITPGATDVLVRPAL